jgi:hypothetical protein
MTAPRAELYLAAGANRVIVFSRADKFNGWICEWENGPFSTLRKLKQLDRVQLPPGFDVAEAIRKGLPVPKPDEGRAA